MALHRWPSIAHLPDGDYAVGDRVLAETGGRWLPAGITRGPDQGRWEVAYDAWVARGNDVVGPERLMPARSAEGYVVDARVLIECGGPWFPGHIVRSDERGCWEVGYDGAHASWNEVVGPDRLLPVGVVEAEPEATPWFGVGDPVLVEWRRRWLFGRVVRVVDEHWREVGFDGWDARRNEVVGVDRLRTSPRWRGARRSTASSATTASATTATTSATTSAPEDKGPPVLIEYGKAWYVGRVLREVEPGRWEIAYDGWDASWNEVVGPDRLRHYDPESDAARGEGFAQGDALFVKWQGRWYYGHVVRVAGDARWEITYDGWDASWNEVVGPERVRRVPPPESRPVPSTQLD